VESFRTIVAPYYAYVQTYKLKLLLTLSEFRNIIFHCIYVLHCATSRKVAGSIPQEVIGFFFSIDLTVAERSNACTAFTRSEAEIVGMEV
jgi:hypothetical protein